MIKQITFDTDALKKIQSGIDKLANVVKVTLGPGGSNVIIERQNMSAITKDGVTIAREIILEDPLENIGAQIVKEAANKTAIMAGDGTSSSVVLAQAIFNEGLKKVVSGVNRIDINKGIGMAVEAVVVELKKMAKPVEPEDLFKVAMISSNGDEKIAKVIEEAIKDIGKDGIVMVENAKSKDTYVKVVEGTRFDRGYLTHYFVTNEERQEVELHNVEILMYDGTISSFREELLPILEKRQARGFDVPLLIIADDVQGEALATLARNHTQKVMSVCAVQAPDFGDHRKDTMKDLAVLVGATIVDRESGYSLKTAPLKVLGSCESIRVTRWTTTIVGGKGKKEDIEDREKALRTLTEEANDNALARLKDRIARLVNGMAIIYVGGNSDVEVAERKDRIDDALQATRGAIEEGILPGGGVAYLRAQLKLDKLWPQGSEGENQGVDIIKGVLSIPIITIVENVGKSPHEVLQLVKVGTDSFGFNAKTFEYEDLMKSGVVDPAKVVRLALENAASISGMLLTTKAVVSLKKEVDNG